MKIKDLIEHLKDYDPEDIIAYTLWTKEDILMTLESMNEYTETEIKLTDEQINNILTNIEKNQDCEYGISWATIEEAIEEEIGYKDLEKRIEEYFDTISDEQLQKDVIDAGYEKLSKINNTGRITK